MIILDDINLELLIYNKLSSITEKKINLKRTLNVRINLLKVIYYYLRNYFRFFFQFQLKLKKNLLNITKKSSSLL